MVRACAEPQLCLLGLLALVQAAAEIRVKPSLQLLFEIQSSGLAIADQWNSLF